MKKKYLLGLLGIACAGILASCGTGADASKTSAVADTTTEKAADTTTTEKAPEPTTTEKAPEPTTTEKEPEPTTTEADPEPVVDEFKIDRVYAEGEEEIENCVSFNEETKTYTINASGEYNISGTLEGNIECSAELTEKVTLNLCGASITSNGVEAIKWNSESSKVVVKAKSETENTVSTGDTAFSAIWSNNNVEIGGKGKLTVVSGKNAISGSEISFTSETIVAVTAKKNAINGKTVLIEGGTFDIQADGIGISAEKTSKGKKGTLTITGGTIQIHDCKTAVLAQASFTVSGENAIAISVVTCEAKLSLAAVSVTATNVTYTEDGVVVDLTTYAVAE